MFKYWIIILSIFISPVSAMDSCKLIINENRDEKFVDNEGKVIALFLKSTLETTSEMTNSYSKYTVLLFDADNKSYIAGKFYEASKSTKKPIKSKLIPLNDQKSEESEFIKQILKKRNLNSSISIKY